MFNKSKEPWFANEIRDRHRRWFSSDTSLCWRHCENSVSQSYARLKIAILFCCRQVYHESYLVLFSTNTFSFQQSLDLSWFFLYHHLEARLYVRKVHLDVLFQSELCRWDLDLIELSGDFKSLRRIYINVEQRPVSLKDFASLKYKDPASSPLTEGSMRLRVSLLKTLTITVSDSHAMHSCAWPVEKTEKYRWTMAQKQEWAGYVRRVLLRSEDQKLATGEVI